MAGARAGVRRTAIGAALALAGCQARPDVEACQRFADAGYGAAVRTQTATIDDTVTTADGIVAATGLDVSTPINRVQAGVWRDLSAQGHTLSLRLVRPDYEAAGPVCAFVLTDGALEDRQRLRDRAARAGADVRVREAAASIGGATGRRLLAARASRGKPARYDCCLAP
jgi:hypothetical protein